jgi:ABC-type transporter Mla MlaB component
VTSDARARPQDEVVTPDQAADGASADGGSTEAARPVPEGKTETGKARRKRASRGGDDDGPRERSRLSVPLVPVLAVLLLLLLAGTAFLWFTRPDPSAVRTADYVGALQAARSNVVDTTSFDYLTLDDDIEQIRRVTTGDLKKEMVDRLDEERQSITDAQTVVNTEVVTAGVVRADDSAATVLLQLQSTQESAAGAAQAQVSKYRIEVELKRDGQRWLLSGITGR